MDPSAPDDVLRAMRSAMLAWYAPRRWRYPWRRHPDPYRTLVSEVMLQQTQAARVAPAFERFVGRFPDVRALAAASKADVIRAWDGLGYNRRALALSEAARTIVREHGGSVPAETAELRMLPGVGPYTASAVAAIGHGVPVAAVDVNVRRVIGRALLGSDPATASRAAIAAAADELLVRSDPAAWQQAVMDLGREVCRPAPRCDACPIAAWCVWHANGGLPRIRRDGPSSSSPTAEPRRRSRFEGSFRQVRGGVIRALRGGPARPADLAVLLERANEEVARAVAALVAEGAVEPGRDGTVRLAESEATEPARPGTGASS